MVRTRRRNLLFAAHVLVCAFALTWPGYAWLGNRIEPYVLGLPFSFAWNVGWLLWSFGGLVVYHLSRRSRG